MFCGWDWGSTHHNVRSCTCHACIGQVPHCWVPLTGSGVVGKHERIAKIRLCAGWTPSRPRRLERCRFCHHAAQLVRAETVVLKGPMLPEVSTARTLK
jgi:hypothetical protein